MRKWVIVLILLLVLLVPIDSYAQSRKRAKNKAKTTAVKKTTGQTSKSSSPKTSEEAKKLQDATKREIKQTEEQIKENENKVKKSLSELGKLDQDIAVTNSNINTLNDKLSKLGTEISGLEKEIERNEEDLAKLRSEYLKAVKKMRVGRKNRSTLAFIFSSKSVGEVMRRMRYLREFSRWREHQTDEISAKNNDLKNQRNALALAKEEQATALESQKKNQAQLALQHNQHEILINELKKNGEVLSQHLKKKQAEASELGNMVSQLIAEEQRKAAEEEARRKAEEERARKEAEEQARLLALKQEEEGRNEKESNIKEEKSNKKQEKTKEDKKNDKNKTSSPSVYADARKRKPRGKEDLSHNQPDATDSKAGSFQEMKGKLPIPTTGSFAITSRFGRQHLPDLPDVEYDNPGIDAETDSGASARAVFKGKVSGVYLLPGYNTVVIINHGNYYTVYGNISSPSVKTGDQVDSGALLGKLATSEEDNKHSSIHFEVWKNREKLNPQEWIR